jgi:hypothetical protein
MNKVNFFISALIVLGLITGINVAKAEGVDITGTWIVSIQDKKGVANPVFELKQDGSAITGTYKGRFGEAPVEGKVDGNTVEFAYSARGGNATIYHGTVNGNKITGTANYGGLMIVDFTAEKK